MILKFYGKIFLICLLGFSFSSCDKLKEKPVASEKVKPLSEEDPSPQTEDQTDQRERDEPLPKTEAPQNKDTVTTPTVKDSTIPDSTTPKKTEESKDMPDDSSVLHFATGGTVQEEVTTPNQGEIIETDPFKEKRKITESPSAPTEALQKPIHFPQEESWKFTLEQVAGFDFIRKGGSDLFYYYIQFWLNNTKSLSQQMDESTIRLMIKNLSFKPLRYIYSRDKVRQEREESVIFLQGQLAPKGWDQYTQEKKESGHQSEEAQPQHITKLLQQLKKMREKNIKKIAINLPHQLHTDMEPFILLGKFIKEKEIDLHIVGGCEHYCATYLIPAARTVYIEPYGYIYRKGGLLGLISEIKAVAEVRRQKVNQEFREKGLPNMTYENRIRFAVSLIMTFKDDLRLQGLFPSFQDRLTVEVPEQAAEFQVQINELSVSDWTAEELQKFVEDLSPRILESLVIFFRVKYNTTELEISSYLNQLMNITAETVQYYAEIKILDLISQKSYGFFQLNTLFGLLLKDKGYEKYFFILRPFYYIPEKDKPFEWVVPSAELLRGVGIDIQGENNVDMIDFPEISSMLNRQITAEQFLYLDSEGIENCGFFEKGAQGYTTEKLKECLSQNVLLQKFFASQKREKGDTGSDLIENEPIPSLGGSEKTLRFPLNEDWKLTLEQITDFDFIKKDGSDLFHYYIQFLFNKISYFLEQVDPNSNYANLLKGLCYESNCSKGFNPQQAAQFGMPSIIRLFSYVGLQGVQANDPDTEESLMFLQGQLAPEGWDLWPYIKEKRQEQQEKTLPQPVENILKLNKWMEKYNVKRIAINLLPLSHEDPLPFVTLGEFIKQQGIDLHIVGGCGHYCAAYLIPAAKTVYIEPYGYVYHKGSFTGLLEEVETIKEAQGEKYLEAIKDQWLSDLTNEEMVDFAIDKIISSTDKENAIKSFLTNLQKDNEELEKEFQEKFSKSEFKMRRKFADFTKEEIRFFIQDLSEKLLKKVVLFFRSSEEESNDKVINSLDYFKRLEYFSQMESKYYSTSNIQNKYTDFLMLSAFLLKDPRYAESFSVPKSFYSIPEKDKPYEWIVPSAELLRSLGIDIRGENNVDMIYAPEFLSMSGLSMENILYLDSKGIENCGFLEEGASSYTTEKIKECLARGE